MATFCYESVVTKKNSSDNADDNNIACVVVYGTWRCCVLFLGHHCTFVTWLNVAGLKK